MKYSKAAEARRTAGYLAYAWVAGMVVERVE